MQRFARPDVPTRSGLNWSFAIVLVGAFIAPAMIATCSRAPKSIDIATTTSVQNSGLLEVLLPRFTEAAVRVHAAGSGRALAMLSDGIVDLAISHAPETEARFLTDHPAVESHHRGDTSSSPL